MLITERRHVVWRWSVCRIAGAAATMSPMRHGFMLMLRSARNVILRSALPRSPMAQIPLWALLNVCWVSVSAPFLGFLNATVMVSASLS